MKKYSLLSMFIVMAVAAIVFATRYKKAQVVEAEETETAVAAA